MAYGLITVCFSIRLVESIPEGLVYPDGSPTFMSTYDAWSSLIELSENSIDIGSFYWSLRSSDIYNHSSSKQGEKIFQSLLQYGLQRNKRLQIAQSFPTPDQPNLDTEYLIKKKAAEVRSVNFPRLMGGGVLHTKLWIIDGMHVYLGSANMDWRSLTQVKELGVLIQNCSCLAKDIGKIFSVYWEMGKDNAQIPAKWPESFSTKFGLSKKTKPFIIFTRIINLFLFISTDSPLKVNFNSQYVFDTFLSVRLFVKKFKEFLADFSFEFSELTSTYECQGSHS